MENFVLRIFVIGVLGLVIALFGVVGITTFYPGPEYPTTSVYDQDPTEAEIKEWEEQNAIYEEQVERHSELVSFIAIGLAVVVMAGGVLFSKRVTLLANSLVIGSLFLFVYGAIAGTASGSSILAFISIGLGLVAIFLLAWKRFNFEDSSRTTRPPQPDFSA